MGTIANFVESTRVVIGVCTRQRPVMLRRCLESLTAQIIPEGYAVHIVVVDNDTAPTARAVVEEAERNAIQITYLHEPRQGIAIARNRVLDVAEGLDADAVAFTDDDCVAEVDWLVWLVRAAEWYEADIVYGQRLWVCPEGREWLMRDLKWREGQPIKRAGTHNVLISCWLFREAGMRFDENLTCGEDTDFAARATKLRFNERLPHGSDSDFSEQAERRWARIIYSRKPLVWEHVPPARATFSYQVRLAFRHSASHADLYRRHEGFASALARSCYWLLWRGPVACVKLASSPLMWPFSGADRFQRRILKYSRRLAGSVGAVAGLFGGLGNPYKNIDGN